MGETVSVLGDADTPELVATTVVSEEQVADEPEYQVTVNVEVPPDQEADRVIDWPLSILGADGVMAPAVRAGLTVTVSVAVAVPPRESVTLTQYVVVDVRAGVV
jgi:hypothetical protein